MTALYAPDAERRYLGALLMLSLAGGAPDSELDPTLFTQLEIGEALSAYRRLKGQGRPANEFSVGDVTGNRAVIRECIDAVVTTVALEDDAAQIREAATRRALLAKAQRAATLAHDEAADLNRELPVLADEIASLRQREAVDDASASIERVADDLYQFAEDKSRLLGRTTGYRWLDRWTAGLRSDLYVVAGRPGMGKSALALQCIDGQQRAGLHVFAASLEMSIGASAMRMALQRMGIAKEALTTFNRGPFLEHMADIRDNRNITWYSSNRSTAIDDIVAAILDAHRERPIDCVWIDHLGYIEHRGERSEGLPYRIGRTTKALARLAHRIEAPVMLLCQLSRAGADGEPPQLIHLRDSGEIEQDARWVWMLHWDGYYQTPRPPAHVGQPYAIYQRKTQDAPAEAIPLMWRQDCAKVFPRSYETEQS